MTGLTHLSLFSGIGGLDLAAEAAGFVTVGQCEWADYPTKVLEKHWANVSRWRDIRTLTKESFYEQTGLRTVDVISGGFPCQPFSTAGKRRGTADDRYLWSEMFRVVEEIRPSWVVGENVAGIVSMAIDYILSDLENIGYETRAFVFPACAVDAPHRRDRVAIVAHAESVGLQGVRSSGEQERGTRLEKGKSERGCYVSDTNNRRRTMRRNGQLSEFESAGKCRENYGGRATEYSHWEWWPAEPDVGRVADGVPSRVDRLKCLGNAVVPAQFYPVFRAIAEIERGDVAP